MIGMNVSLFDGLAELFVFFSEELCEVADFFLPPLFNALELTGPFTTITYLQILVRQLEEKEIIHFSLISISSIAFWKSVFNF